MSVGLSHLPLLPQPTCLTVVARLRKLVGINRSAGARVLVGADTRAMGRSHKRGVNGAPTQVIERCCLRSNQNQICCGFVYQIVSVHAVVVLCRTRHGWLHAHTGYAV